MDRYSRNKLGYLWLLQPILFIISLHYLNYYPERVVNNIPNIMFWLNENSTSVDNNLEVPTRFTFLDYVSSVNLLLIISLIGILVLLWPFLYIILKKSFGILIIIRELIIKVRDILEVVGYFVSYIIIANSYKYEEYGFYIAMAGALSFFIVFSYSYYKHKKYLFDDEMITFHVIIANMNIPIALYHNSSFLGLIAVIAVHGSITRSKISSGLCYIVNLDKEDRLYRSVMVSLIAVPLFLIMRHFDHLTYLRPFIQPVYTIGTLLLLIKLLYMTSNFIKYGKSFVQSQTIMITTLIVFGCIGKLLNLELFTNNSLIYSILYILGKIKIPRSCDTIIIFSFMMSIVMFAISQFLTITFQSILSVTHSVLFI